MSTSAGKRISRVVYVESSDEEDSVSGTKIKAPRAKKPRLPSKAEKPHRYSSVWVDPVSKVCVGDTFNDTMWNEMTFAEQRAWNKAVSDSMFNRRMTKISRDYREATEKTLLGNELQLLVEADKNQIINNEDEMTLLQSKCSMRAEYMWL